VVYLQWITKFLKTRVVFVVLVKSLFSSSDHFEKEIYIKGRDANVTKVSTGRLAELQ
jgi:hypothetical protein